MVQAFLEIQDTIKKQKISHFALSLKEICNKLNINNATPKSFRRWLKTELSKLGVRVEFIKRMMGFDISIDYNFAYSNVWANRINDVYELDEFINSL